MNQVHIVGAGLAGLATAVRLAAQGRRVKIYESSGHAGGRCRSFHDSVLDCTIDNGNHLLLSGNRSVQAYLQEVGSENSLTGPSEAVFPFLDLATDDRWTVKLNTGRFPWWIFRPDCRPPGSSATDFLSLVKLALAGPDATIGDLFGDTGPIFTRFMEPLAVAALNTPVDAAAARPLWAVLRETFGRGGGACRPLMAHDGLSQSFIDPALSRLHSSGAEIYFNKRLKQAVTSGDKVSHLEFSDSGIDIAAEDSVVLALPPAGLKSVLPVISVPEGSHAIVNAHFKLSAPLPEAHASPILGLIGGVAEWVFIRGSVVSVTVSAADRLADDDATVITNRLWRDVAHALKLSGDPPPARIVKERRATFAQTPEAMRRRPDTKTKFANLYLAGDWTNTGLPATIEGAIRSGHKAAASVLSA